MNQIFVILISTIAFGKFINNVAPAISVMKSC